MQHLWLVSVPLLAATVVAMPLGVAATKRSRVGKLLVAAAVVVQAIPFPALLALVMAIIYLLSLLPGVGGLSTLGATPVIVWLFVCDVVLVGRAVHAGVRGIAAELLEAADALGLSRRWRFWNVELPLASRSILAGVGSAATLNVILATFGAVVGAGGFGQPIVAGLLHGDAELILLGLVPTIALAFAVRGLFGLAARFFVPKGLRLE
jgi:osmoprotectant transport system permease protein